MGDEDQRAVEPAQRVLERLAALDVEVVGRLVEDQDVGSRGDEDRERQATQLAAGQHGDLLLGVGAREQEPAQQGPRLSGSQTGRPLRRLQGGALLPDLLGVLGEEAQLDVVAAAQLAVRERPAAGERLDQRRLARAVGADDRDVLAALEPQLGVLDQRAVAGADRRVLELERHASGAARAVELEPDRAAVGRIVLEPVHLGELLDA